MTNKEKCEELRKLRVKIAEDLGKPELVRNEPCNFNGECSGTCPACYKEEEALMKELYKAYENDNAFIVSNRKVHYTEEDMNYFESDIEDYSMLDDMKVVKPSKKSVDNTEDNKELPIFKEFNPFGNTSVTSTPGKIDFEKPKSYHEEPPIARIDGLMIPPSFDPIDSAPNKEDKKLDKTNKKKLFSKRSKK